jgi:hypothetical protein
MNHRWSKLTIVAMATFAAVGTVVVLSGETGMTTLVGIPLVLILPGYALTMALFGSHLFSRIERLVTSIGLSIAIVALTAFLLNQVPDGMSTTTWAVSLGLVTLGSCMVAALRQPEGSEKNKITPPNGYRLSFRSGLWFGSTTLVTVTAIVTAYLAANSQLYPDFTQLWIVPSHNTTSPHIELGLHSGEAAPTHYHLELRIGSRLIENWLFISLRPGETWRTIVDLPPEMRQTQTIEARLYKTNSPTTIYRHVRLSGISIFAQP